MIYQPDKGFQQTQWGWNGVDNNSYPISQPDRNMGVSQPGCYQYQDMSMQDTKAQVANWQQDSYLVDSGIQSESSTCSNSQTGAEDDMENAEWVEGPPGHRYNQPSYPNTAVVNNFNNQMMNCNVIQYNTPQQAAPQRWSHTSQMLKNAADIDYQDNAALSRAIPDLIKLLNDGDHVIVSQAAEMVCKLSKKEKSMCAIINSTQMMSSMVRVLSLSHNLHTVKAISCALYNISTKKLGLQYILKCGGVLALVKHLSSPVEILQYYAITTLHNMLEYLEDSKTEVRKTNALQKMVALLSTTSNIKFLTIIMDCMRSLSYHNDAAKLLIFRSGGPAVLVRIMRTSDYEKLLFTTSRVLKVLSVCSSNKPAIVEAGGMQALANYLTHQSLRLVQNCLWALRNLSDAATKLNDMEFLLQNLITLLKSSPNSSVITCSVGILSNLTCNNQNNKKTVLQCNGIQTLIATIYKAGNAESIIQPAVCALRHLTISYEDSVIAQSSCYWNNGIPVIARLLHPPFGWPLLKTVLGLLRNVALHSSNLENLRNCGVLQQLAHLLLQTINEIQRLQSEGAVFTQMEDLLDGILGVISILLRNPYNRNIFRGLNIIPLIVQAMYRENITLQRRSLGILREMAAEKLGIVQMEEAAIISPLQSLRQSGHEDIANLADEILGKIEEHQVPLVMAPVNGIWGDDSALWSTEMVTMPSNMSHEYIADVYEPVFNSEPQVTHSGPSSNSNGQSSAQSSQACQNYTVGYDQMEANGMQKQHHQVAPVQNYTNLTPANNMTNQINNFNQLPDNQMVVW